MYHPEKITVKMEEISVLSKSNTACRAELFKASFEYFHHSPHSLSNLCHDTSLINAQASDCHGQRGLPGRWSPYYSKVRPFYVVSGYNRSNHRWTSEKLLFLIHCHCAPFSSNLLSVRWNLSREQSAIREAKSFTLTKLLKIILTHWIRKGNR